MKKFFIALCLFLVSILGFGQNPFAVSLNEAKDIFLTHLRISMNDTSTLGTHSMYIIDSISFHDLNTYSIEGQSSDFPTVLWYSWKDATVAYCYMIYSPMINENNDTIGWQNTGSFHTTFTVRGILIAADKRMKPVYIMPNMDFVYGMGSTLDIYDTYYSQYYSQHLWWCKSVYDAYYYKLNCLHRIAPDVAWENIPADKAVDWTEVWDVIKEPVYLDTLYIDTLYLEVHDTTYITVHDTVYLDSLGNVIGQWDLFKNIKVYPNPTSDFINVEGAENSMVTIYNELGQAILNRRIDSEFETLNMSGFVPGIYFIKFGNQIVKLIKE